MIDGMREHRPLVEKKADKAALEAAVKELLENRERHKIFRFPGLFYPNILEPDKGEAPP